MADNTDLSTPPETISAGDKPHDEGSKLKTFLSILRNIGKSDDELGRMLEVLRFWFTKDLCNWEVENDQPPLNISGGSVSTDNPVSREKVKISYLTEQTSHHPPVSAFYVDCPKSGVVARGFDQISAKFTGTSVRVSPGQHNLGIFINLTKRDNEEYRLTHPDAHLGGLLRGALSISVADTCYITCAQTRIKTILTYLPDGWLSAAQHKVTGVVLRYDPEYDDKTKIKDIPEEDILARIDGSWQGKIYYTLANSDKKELLIDVLPLFPVPKEVPALEDQLPNESRKYWAGVTDAILTKEYGLATQRKQELEENKRREAAERKASGKEWKPRFFSGSVDASGKPELTEEGKKILKDLHENQFAIQGGESGTIIENPDSVTATKE
ncbi:hypothetical protein KEM54_006731 [Ascosphaera aggregata]|nr:hypothetical protein KEM54_006731 [Ascosphaera aggregata]